MIPRAKMTIGAFVLLASALGGTLAAADDPPVPAPAPAPYPDAIVDNLPSDVVASMEVRDRWVLGSSTPSVGSFSVLDDLRRWLPNQTLRVAFLGGNAALHRDIADATIQITDACSIKFDFGPNAAAGQFRTWSTNDVVHQAEIRVSFDQGGNFSLVGADSASTMIGSPGGAVGGRPGQRSLNLGGFHLQRPVGWRGTTRHEFLHAIAFQHEHQSPIGGCDNEFRFQDDPGYQPTQDLQGRFVNDGAGRRPGIYSLLAGFPNFWEQNQVDHNLRQLAPGSVSTTPFDRRSVMLYRFPAEFYRTNPSPCAPIGDGQDLSDGDKAGLLRLYPRDAPAVAEATASRQSAFDSLLNSDKVAPQMKASVQAQFNAIE